MSDKFIDLQWFMDFDLCDEEGPLDEPEFNGRILDQDNMIVCKAVKGINANLICAAPEMYNNIKAMCRAELELGTCLPSDCEHCPMNKVLKKARGES